MVKEMEKGGNSTSFSQYRPISHPTLSFPFLSNEEAPESLVLRDLWIQLKYKSKFTTHQPKKSTIVKVFDKDWKSANMELENGRITLAWEQKVKPKISIIKKQGFHWDLKETIVTKSSQFSLRLIEKGFSRQVFVEFQDPTTWAEWLWLARWSRSLPLPLPTEFIPYTDKDLGWNDWIEIENASIGNQLVENSVFEFQKSKKTGLYVLLSSKGIGIFKKKTVKMTFSLKTCYSRISTQLECIISIPQSSSIGIAMKSYFYYFKILLARRV